MSELEIDKEQQLAALTRAMAKLGVGGRYATKHLTDYGAYGVSAKEALESYPRSVGFIGENMVIHDLFCSSILYSAVKLRQNVIHLDIYKIKHFADNNDLATMVECSTRPTCLYIDGVYNDMMVLDTSKKEALFATVRTAKKIGIPVHFYAFCEGWKELEAFYGNSLSLLLQTKCTSLGRES